MKELGSFATKYIIEQTVQDFPIKTLSKEALVEILMELISQLFNYSKLINKISRTSLKKYQKLVGQEDIYVFLKKDNCKILGVNNNKIIFIDKGFNFYLEIKKFDELSDDCKECFFDKSIDNDLLIKSILDFKNCFENNDQGHYGLSIPEERARWQIINIFQRIKF